MTETGTHPTTLASRGTAAHLARAMLGCGVVAGPFYLVVGLIQALTRDGFDLTRHDLSLLANGDLGWIHITDLILSGLMTIAAASGVRRVLAPGRGSTWGPRLIGAYGVGLIAAGAFVADPADGFPPGTPPGPGAISWHGFLHFITGGLGFLALIAACFVIASRFAAEHQRAWAVYSRATGIVFFVGFAGITTGSGNPIAVLALWIGVITAWAWITTLSVHFYRQTPPIAHRSRTGDKTTPHR